MLASRTAPGELEEQIFEIVNQLDRGAALIDLPEERDEETLLHAMGSEAANVHLGRERQTKNILKDLRRRKANWLRSAAKDMAKAMERDWKDYANA